MLSERDFENDAKRAALWRTTCHTSRPCHWKSDHRVKSLTRGLRAWPIRVAASTIDAIAVRVCTTHRASIVLAPVARTCNLGHLGQQQQRRHTRQREPPAPCSNTLQYRRSGRLTINITSAMLTPTAVRPRPRHRSWMARKKRKTDSTTAATAVRLLTAPRRSTPV